MKKFPELSNRELDVVKLLLDGKSNKQIASAMNITDRTVEFHLNNIYTKFGVSSRIELVLILKDPLNKAELEKLGISTVAPEGENPENRDTLNILNKWAISLRGALSSINKEQNMESTINVGSSNRGTSMSFFEAIITCFKKFAEFGGKATRPEYWWFALFTTIIGLALATIHEALGGAFLILMLLPLAAAGTRRLHDTGKSGWLQLYVLIPYAGIFIAAYLLALPTVDTESSDSLSA
jgi:DNA-binding CsgD family transcriptional regulator